MKLIDPPHNGVFRIGRADRPVFAPPDWEHSGSGRYDDPRRLEPFDASRNFRVVYGSTSLFGSFVETLQKFRPSLAVLAGVGSGGSTPTGATGQIPSGWLARRHWAEAKVATQCRFADCAAGETFASLREQPKLAAIAVELGIDDIDVSAVTGPYRPLTQAVAAHVHETIPDCAGIRYVSRFGTEIDFECWAIFADRVLFRTVEPDRQISPNLPEFQRAMTALNLSLNG